MHCGGDSDLKMKVGRGKREERTKSYKQWQLSASCHCDIRSRFAHDCQRPALLCCNRGRIVLFYRDTMFEVIRIEDLCCLIVEKLCIRVTRSLSFIHLKFLLFDSGISCSPSPCRITKTCIRMSREACCCLLRLGPPWSQLLRLWAAFRWLTNWQKMRFI